MTKQVQDKDGNVSTVPINTPCKAAKNGGLPTLYTTEEAAVIDPQQAIDSAAWDADAIPRNAKKEIARLEGEITQRRVREAVLGTDNGWLADQEVLIATERAKL